MDYFEIGGNSFACDFTYDSCGWTQDKSDNFDWRRNNGTTSSVRTGPNGDHTSGSMKYCRLFGTTFLYTSYQMHLLPKEMPFKKDELKIII